RVAVVVDAVPADLRRAGVHGGVVVVAVVAPGVAVAVHVGGDAGHAVLAVDEALEVGRALGHDGPRRLGGLLDLRGGGPGVGIAGGGRGDLLRPGVDPALDLRHVELPQQVFDGVRVLHAPAGVREDDAPLVARDGRRL